MDVEEVKRRLFRIYSRIPKLRCKENCGKCCGVHHWFYAEWLVITDWLKKHGRTELFAKSIFDPCPYLDERRRCTIYEVRPTICRLYGVVETLRCPYVKPERYLTEEEARQILNEVVELSKQVRRVIPWTR